jgi:hypothetical protein
MLIPQTINAKNSSVGPLRSTLNLSSTMCSIEMACDSDWKLSQVVVVTHMMPVIRPAYLFFGSRLNVIVEQPIIERELILNVTFRRDSAPGL